MTSDIRQIEHGWDVYGSDDKKVGDVAEVGSNYLLVQKGWLFTRDFYIPISAIAGIAQNEVRLNLTSSEIESQGWDAPPVEDTSTYTSGTAGYTSGTTGSTTETAGYTAETSGMAATSGRNLDTSEEVAIPVVEESISVGKREVETGGVRVTQRVEEVPVNEQVTLRDEEVRVERRAVDRPVTDADLSGIREGVVEVREYDEQAVVAKEARIVEEVVVGKEVSERTETIQDSVRRTDVDVQQLSGETRVQGTTTSGTMSGSGATASGGGEGLIERGLSQAENAAERTTGADLNRDGDVGQRDPRNNY